MRSGGPNLRAINGCRSGAADYFLSLDPGCETRTALGRYGFAFTGPPANEPTVALHRCSRPGRGHFASLDANCEGVLSVQLVPGASADRVSIAQFTLLDVKRVISAAAIDGAAAATDQHSMPTGSTPKL